MSSNIFSQRICEECGNQFTTRTTVTRFCGDRCAKRAYKSGYGIIPTICISFDNIIMFRKTARISSNFNGKMVVLHG